MYYLIRIAGAILYRLPPRVVEGLGTLLGRVWFYVIPFRRRVVLDNLRHAFPEHTEAQRRRLGRASMEALATHVLETAAWFPARPEELAERIEWEGWEHVEHALASGQGFLGLGTHIDNPEWMIQGFGARGHVTHGAVRLPKQPGVRRALTELRDRAGFRGYRPRESLRPLLRALRNNEPVTVIIDQCQSRRRGVFVPFFGQPASTTPGLAALAQRTGRPVIPVVPYRTGPGRRRLQVGPPIPLDDLRDDPEFIRKATARFTAVVEAHIRRQPERWLWAHRRFKVAPHAEDAVAEAQTIQLHSDGRVELEPSAPAARSV